MADHLVIFGLEVEGGGVVKQGFVMRHTLERQLDLTLHVFWRDFWFDDVRKCQSNYVSRLLIWLECKTQVLWRLAALPRSVAVARGVEVLTATNRRMLMSFVRLLLMRAAEDLTNDTT